MTRYAIALCLTLCAPALQADPADEVTAERFPDADSALVDCRSSIEYAPDGTYRRTDEQWVKVLTDKGRREESELSLSYSARYGAARILSVGIIGTNGVERAVDFAATTKESTDNRSMNENIYDPMDRRIRCAVPGLQVGETIRFKTERSTFKSRIEGQWADVEVMEWDVPFVRASVEVWAPKELPLKWAVVRNPLGNVVSSERPLGDGSVLHVWTVTNSPQAFPEPDMPPLYTQVQNLQLSTAESWEQISRWYWDLCLPHMERADEAVTNKVAEIAAGVAGDGREALVRAVYKWVAQEIRYMGLTLEDTSPGYAPHDVDLTFRNRYGVCRDKAALLAAMLRIAGVEAYPVLIQAGAKKDPEVPSPFFNHAIVAVASDGGYTLMDPTDESSRDLMPAYLCNSSYLVAKPEGETLRTSPVAPASENLLSVEAEGVLDAEGAVLLEQRISFTGIHDNAFRQSLLRKKPEERVKAFEAILGNRFPGAELLDCRIEPEDLHDTDAPLRAVLRSRLPDAVVRGDTRDELSPPLITPSLGGVSWLLDGKTSLETRKYPLVVDTTAAVEETLSLKLGDFAGRKAALPEDRDAKGKYDYSRTFRVEDGRLVVRRRAAVNDVEFSPAEYAALRDAVKSVEEAEREKAVFEKDDEAGANVHYLRHGCEADLAGDSCWTMTNTVVKKILTYDGKKRSSELKFSYNPTWESVEIVSAVVSNRDGRVSRLDASEVNVMDCGWASAAPRYPASKQMIVNLPSVEVGSVVSYTVARTATNAPAPFYFKWNFDVYEPTDELFARCGEDWSRTVVRPKLVKSEEMAAPAEFWRDETVVSSNSFAGIAEKLRRAADVESLDPREALGEDAPLDAKGIRDWMAKHVRVAGPSLYELPLEMQTTDPKTVIEERYGARLDYMRAMCALLRGAGYDADVVFVSSDGGLDPNLQKFHMYDHPDVRAFAAAVCRIRERTGGWLWGLLPFGRECRETFIGLDNEYTPFGATSLAGSHYFDPWAEDFAVVTQAAEFTSHTRFETKMSVRENGAVDFDISQERRGPAVGAFRKKYAEMLPEDRSRHHQKLLGSIAQSASATGEFVTDTESYPAKLSFSCYVPSYANVEGDAISLTLPSFQEPLFPLSGAWRTTPVNVGPADGETTVFEVTFPKGYTEIEHLPEQYVFRNPLDFNHAWYQCTVSTRFDDEGRLVVAVARERTPRIQVVLSRESASMLRGWSRVGSSLRNRTLSVRRAK